MSDDEKTLGVLIRTSRYASTTRRLVCPKCEVDGITLVNSRLHCLWCEWSGEKLAELAVKR